MAAKRVVKKKSASPPPGKTVQERYTPNAVIDSEENDRVRASGNPAPAPPKIHAKVVQLILSVGSDDRQRSWEDFEADIRKKLGLKKYGEPGLHGTVTGGYYILDGVVCLPEDYDKKNQSAKKGTYPPQWAGGPSTQMVTLKTQIQKDLDELTPDEYDKKYGLGKYGPQPVSLKVTPEGRRKAPRLTKLVKEELEDAELEEFEWDEEDLTEEAMGKVADESASRAVAKLQGNKKRVVKKPAPKPKRVVRVKK